MNIGIIGVGKLGLPYALCFAEKGINVLASSYKKDYIDELNSGNYKSTEPGVLDLYRQLDNIGYTEHNHEVIRHSEIIYVMVATPSLDDGFYDVSAIWSVIDDIHSYPGDLTDKILVIGSTVNPGDCVKFRDAVKDLGMHLAYCPTFVAQGSVLNNIRDPHTLSIGTESQTVFNRCQDLFSKIITPDTPIFHLHPTTAEILKLAGNCRATMEIVFFNLIGEILIKSGMQQDIPKANQYLNGVKKKARYELGFGYGGPCFPRDNRALVEFSKTIGIPYELGPVVDQSNQTHGNFLYQYFKSENNRDLPYYFDYISYKSGVAIFEESQQLQIAKKLLSDGHKVYVNPTEFLPEEVKKHLKERFTDLIEFNSIQELEQQNIEVFVVGFKKSFI